MVIRNSSKEDENKDIIVPTVKKAQGRLQDLKIDFMVKHPICYRDVADRIVVMDRLSVDIL